MDRDAVTASGVGSSPSSRAARGVRTSHDWAIALDSDRPRAGHDRVHLRSKRQEQLAIRVARDLLRPPGRALHGRPPSRPCSRSRRGCLRRRAQQAKGRRKLEPLDRALAGKSSPSPVSVERSGTARTCRACPCARERARGRRRRTRAEPPPREHAGDLGEGYPRRAPKPTSMSRASMRAVCDSRERSRISMRCSPSW